LDMFIWRAWREYIGHVFYEEFEENA
jgi:hypothetical protein